MVFVSTHAAEPHHRDAVADLLDDGEVVGDQEHRHVVGALQLADQLQDLGLHGDVERGGRLVGDQQLGIVGDRDGDHHALALAAGELVRILLEPRLRLGMRTSFRRSSARAQRLLLGQALMQDDRLRRSGCRPGRSG